MNTDYCDRCGAAARSRYTIGEYDLVFCGHHTRILDGELLNAGATFDPDFASDHTPVLVNA